jgi:hypothetical protein
MIEDQLGSGNLENPSIQHDTCHLIRAGKKKKGKKGKDKRNRRETRRGPTSKSASRLGTRAN